MDKGVCSSNKKGTQAAATRAVRRGEHQQPPVRQLGGSVPKSSVRVARGRQEGRAGGGEGGNPSVLELSWRRGKVSFPKRVTVSARAFQFVRLQLRLLASV